MSNINDNSQIPDEYLKSYWIDSTQETNYPSLNKDMSADVAIVGGGIVGITAAYLLKKQGLRVILIESGRIVQGATGFTTAKITSQHHLIYNKIINSMSVDCARQYAQANESSIDFIEDMTKELNINCDFETLPSYMYTNDDKYLMTLQKEAEAASRLGIAAEYVDNMPIDIPMKSAVVFHNQAQFNPRKYLLPIAKRIEGDSSYIFENTEVIEVHEGKNISLITNRGYKVTAPKVIIASHFPCYDGKGMYLTRLRPQRSYVVAVSIEGSFPKATFINTENPGRSLRGCSDNGEQLVLIGGEGHKTAHGSDFSEHYNNLIQFGRSVFKINDIKYKWSTQDYVTIDDVPYIGNLTSSEKNIYVATGFREWGMTNGTAAARILADEILDRDNPWKEVFNPSRHFNGPAYKNLFSENFDVAKELVKSKIKAPEKKIDVEPGEGKIVEINGRKYGAYRDDEGELHIVDSTCTHVGCELTWNDAEKSWDCACHGSRFTYDGDILEGPATHKLHRYGEGKNKIDPNLFSKS